MLLIDLKVSMIFTKKKGHILKKNFFSLSDPRAYICVAWWFFLGANPGAMGPETFMPWVKDSLKNV